MKPDFEQEDRDARRLFDSAGLDPRLPAGRRQALRGRFIAALRAGHAAPARPVATSPRRKVLYFKVASATAAALAVGVLCWLLAGSDAGRAKAALPEVVGKVRAARTATYDLSMVVAGGNQIHFRVWMASPGKMRMEADDGKVNIFDYAARAKLILRPHEMTASLFDLLGGDDIQSEIDPLQRVRDLHAAEGLFVGRRDLDGRRAWIYESIRDIQKTTIWVDPATELPFRVQTRSLTAAGKEFVVTLDNFAWNVPIADSMFSLTPPPGYRIKENDRPAPDPDMVADMLRACAGVAGGAFPPGLDRKTLVLMVFEDLKRRKPTAVATQESFSMSEFDQAAKDAYWTCMRGLMAVQRLQVGNEWRYTGAGAKLGDSGAIICWWGRPGASTRTAVFGDLKIKEIKTSEIPASRP